MTPERWRQVEDLFHAALAQEPGRRSAFLVRASNGDEELRGEVERLLEQNGSLEERLERPAWEGGQLSESGLASGTQLGPYRIEGPLGAGGMGQVYKGRDTRLDRPVAIKVVAEEYSNRIEREARAISGLNHPHICTLYDVGPGYLVMELVEGETLAARLKQGRLPMDAVLRYGAEIADALAAAHAKGIIHRDLKPGNLMVTKSGIKVLDFGLARIVQPDETMTASHVVQGTPAYMAPEQLEGKRCDARTDIYALGLVLYEMATGKRLKQGDTANLGDFPERVAHVVERCLAHEPDDRWQTARDVKHEFEWAAARPAQSLTPQRTSRWTWVAAALVCAGLLAVALAVWPRGSTPGAQYPARFTLSFDELALESFGVPRPSPDGRYFAFVARGEQEQDALWLRPLDSVDARMLPGTEGATAPFWSPDGRWIGFYANRILKKISPDGGPPRTIAALPSLVEAAWGANGDILYRPGNRTPLNRIHESGGPSRQVTKLDAERTENSHRSPVFLPDGRRFLFTTRCGRREHNAVYLGSLDSTEIRRLMPLQSNVKHVSAREGDPGLLLYYRDSMLVAHPFDAEREKLAGDPVPVIGNVAYTQVGAMAQFDVAAAGNLVILRPASATERQLTWFSRSGAVIGVTGPPRDYHQPRLSPQSDRIAFNRFDEQTGNRDIWSIEVARGVAARLTTHEANDWFPVWSPDGKHMMFGSDREGGTHSPPHLKKSMDPGSHESRLPYDWDELGVPYDRVPYDWSRDGRWVTMGTFDIWVAPVSGNGTPFPFVATSFNEGGARFSPDAKWIAYTSDETGRAEVYVRPFAGAPSTGEGKIRISSAGGGQPVWRVDGQELFYLSSDRHLYGVSTRGLTVGGAAPVPARLFRPCTETAGIGPGGSQYDTHDGQRFVFSCRTEPPGRFVVLMNWAARR